MIVEIISLKKWMNVNKSNVRIFSSTSHIGGFDGYQNLIVNNGTPYSTPQSLKGGMFVNLNIPITVMPVVVQPKHTLIMMNLMEINF